MLVVLLQLAVPFSYCTLTSVIGTDQALLQTHQCRIGSQLIGQSQ